MFNIAIKTHYIEIIPNNKAIALKEPVFADPYDTIHELDKYIIGQDEAKKTLAVALLQRSIRANTKLNPPLSNNHILFIGNTGTGKTATIRALSKVINEPITIVDITSYTSSGYVGNSVDDIILAAAHNMVKVLGPKFTGSPKVIVELIENSIVYIDEIDKIARETNPTTKDVGGKGVQVELLKLLDQQSIKISSRTIGDLTINTENMLFICGGAFADLESIIKKRLAKNNSIGFGAMVDTSITAGLTKVTTQDLINYGFIPEFIGRFTNIVTFNKLSVDDLCRILVEPENSVIKQHQNLFKEGKTDLQFSDLALRKISEIASKQNTGARGLKKLVSIVLKPYYLEFSNLPSKLVINEEDVDEMVLAND